MLLLILEDVTLDCRTLSENNISSFEAVFPAVESLCVSRMLFSLLGVS